MKTCPYCETLTLRKNGLPEGRQRYKCTNCERNILEGAKLDFTVRERKGKKTRPCAYCSKETTNPKFCSRSCTSTYNNLHQPERYELRKKQRYCKHCGVEIPNRRKICDDCHRKLINWDTRTIADITHKAKYQIHSHIRQRARYRYKTSNRPQCCANCGYDKHIEICHIRAISDFPTDSIISEINSPENLVALCPNCHWELDNGHLTQDEIQNKQ